MDFPLISDRIAVNAAKALDNLVPKKSKDAYDKENKRCQIKVSTMSKSQLLRIQHVILLGFFIINFAMASTSLEDFFPNINGNLTKITWAHAVNNKEYLEKTLKNDEVMMIEADVIMGKTDKDKDKHKDYPIMGHPPNVTSDLTLQEFLESVTDFNKNAKANKKGIKLDFKTIDAFENSVPLINIDEIKDAGFPIWINADILKGPIKSSEVEPVDPDKFLEGAKSFPNFTLSVGWTTNYGPKMTGSYAAGQINEMLKRITAHNISQPITFPVRAGLAAESEDLLRLLEVNNSTLTIWSHEGDNVSVDHLRKLLGKVGITKVYVDVPSELLSQLHLDDLPSSSTRFNLSFLGFVMTAFLFLVTY